MGAGDLQFGYLLAQSFHAPFIVKLEIVSFVLNSWQLSCPWVALILDGLDNDFYELLRLERLNQELGSAKEESELFIAFASVGGGVERRREFDGVDRAF
jgi:hypothetical protein